MVKKFIAEIGRIVDIPDEVETQPKPAQLNTLEKTLLITPGESDSRDALYRQERKEAITGPDPDLTLAEREQRQEVKAELEKRVHDRATAFFTLDLAHVASEHDEQGKLNDIGAAIAGGQGQGHQDEQITFEERQVIGDVAEALTGERPDELLRYLASSHDKQLARHIEGREGFLYESCVQLAGALKDAGVTTKEDIISVIKAGFTAPFGILKPEVEYHFQSVEFDGGGMKTIDVAEQLADMIAEGKAVDMGAVKLGGSVSSHPVMVPMINNQAYIAFKKGPESPEAKALPHLLSSMTDIPVEELKEAIAQRGESENKITEAKLGKLKEAVEYLSGKSPDAVFDEGVADLVLQDVFVNHLINGKSNPEVRAIAERLLHYQGAREDGLISQLKALPPTFKTKWDSLTDAGKGRVRKVITQEAPGALFDLYAHTNVLRKAYGERTDQGDVEARINTSISLIRSARFEASGRVVKYAAQKGEAQMSAAQSDAETDLINATHFALGRSPEFVGQPGGMIKRLNKPTGTYAEYEKRQDTSKKGPYAAEVKQYSKAPLGRSMEATVLIAEDMSKKTGRPMPECLADVLIATADVFGFPLDDKFVKGKKMDQLVKQLVEFRAAHPEVFEAKDAYGIVAADVDFATGKKLTPDFNYSAGTLLLMNAAAQASYGAEARQSLAPGFRSMDTGSMNEGAVLQMIFPSLIAHGFRKRSAQGHAVDIAAGEAHAIAADLLGNVPKRDAAINSIFVEMLDEESGGADMTKSKYSGVVDPRLPDGLPFEVVNTVSALPYVAYAIGSDQKVEPEEVFMLTRLLPELGARSPDLVNMLAGISDPKTGRVYRNAVDGSIQNYDRRLQTLVKVGNSAQAKRVLEALRFADVLHKQE